MICVRYGELPVIERVPEHHMHSVQSKALIEAFTDRSLDARAAILDVTDQFWVYSATWGLVLWEELLGIETDPGLSVDARRAAIVARMRGTGTCNADKIRSVVQAITGHRSVVVERPGEYAFSLIFVGDEPGLINVKRQAIIDAVEEVKPAHLQFVIEGITWKDLHAMAYTWAKVHAEEMTWDDLHTRVMVQQDMGDAP